jgi:hypothetical protein
MLVMGITAAVLELRSVRAENLFGGLGTAYLS